MSWFCLLNASCLEQHCYRNMFISKCRFIRSDSSNLWKHEMLINVDEVTSCRPDQESTNTILVPWFSWVRGFSTYEFRCMEQDRKCLCVIELFQFVHRRKSYKNSNLNPKLNEVFQLHGKIMKSLELIITTNLETCILISQLSN